MYPCIASAVQETPGLLAAHAPCRSAGVLGKFVDTAHKHQACAKADTYACTC
jgi:hypothetical protein